MSECILDTVLTAQGYGRHLSLFNRAHGPLVGASIDHLCRQRACINLAHLERVSPAENARRMQMAKRVIRELGEQSPQWWVEFFTEHGDHESLHGFVWKGRAARPSAAGRRAARPRCTPRNLRPRNQMMTDTLTTRVTPEVADRFREIARERGSTVSRLIGEGVESLLAAASAGDSTFARELRLFIVASVTQ